AASGSFLERDHRAIRNLGAARDADNAIANVIDIGMVFYLDVRGVIDPHVLADAAILVENCSLDDRAGANSQIGTSLARILFALGIRFNRVGADENSVEHRDVAADAAAVAENAPLNRGPILNHTTIGDAHSIDLSRADSRWRQISHTRVNSSVRGVKLE